MTSFPDLRRTLLAALLSLVTAASLLALTGQPASAAATGPITGLAGKCIGAAGGNTANGTLIDLYPCVGDPAQQWTLPGDGTIRTGGRCMDVAGAGTADGTVVQLYDCNGTAAQQWVFSGARDLVNPNANKCLDLKAVAWKTGIWFWMTSTGAGSMTAHNAMVGGAGFGQTIRTINGSLECDGKRPDLVQARVSAYQRFTGVLGVGAGNNLYC